MTTQTQNTLSHSFSAEVRNALKQELDPTNLGFLEREFRGQKEQVPYLPAEKAMRLLNGIFGPANWGVRIKEHTLVEKIVDTVTEKYDPRERRYVTIDKPYEVFTLVYKCHMDFVCVDPVNGYRSESKDNIGIGTAEKVSKLSLAHDTAAKAAVTDALSRCVYGLGDPFGLCLRDKEFVRELMTQPQNGTAESRPRQASKPIQTSTSTQTATVPKTETPATMATELHIKQILNKAQKAKMNSERMYAEISSCLNREITDLGELTQNEAKVIINADW